MKIIQTIKTTFFPSVVRFDESMYTETGAWTFDNKKDLKDHHFFDKPLCKAFANFLKQECCRLLMDLGCGDGEYIWFLNSNTKICATGIDGNPVTYTITNGFGTTADLTGDRTWRKADWVLCLEVGEHIPAKYADQLLDNICSTAEKGVIMSWAIPGQDGLGHINCRTNHWVEKQMEKRGFTRVPMTEQLFRNVATIKWFKDTLMVYRRQHD